MKFRWTNMVTQPALRLALCAVIAAGLSACDGRTELTNETDGTSPPTPLSEHEAYGVEVLDLEAGVLWQRTTDNNSGNGNNNLEAEAYSFSGMTWVPITAGQARVVAVAMNAGETLSAHATPLDGNGNLDIYLFDGDPTFPNPWIPPAIVKQSNRAIGYVDQVFYTAPAARTYYVKLYCAAGTCAFTTQIGKGDSTAFTVGGIYLNQRSFTTVSGKCRNDNNVAIRDGECMCAPSSSAMAVVMGGKRPVTGLRNAAVDVYTTNDANGGAANRYALMPYLTANYGYATCSETVYSGTMLDTLKSSLRAGKFVIFRSPQFSKAGHYINVRGYNVINGRNSILVNDPYGAWTGYNIWSPANTTDAGSTNGDTRYYDYQSVINASASIIVCN